MLPKARVYSTLTTAFTIFINVSVIQFLYQSSCILLNSMAKAVSHQNIRIPPLYKQNFTVFQWKMK